MFEKVVAAFANPKFIRFQLKKPEILIVKFEKLRFSGFWPKDRPLALEIWQWAHTYPRQGRTLEKDCTNLFYGRSMAKCQGTKDCSLCWVFKVGGRCTMDGKKCTFIKFHVQKTVFFRIFGPKILKKNNFSKISNLKSKWSNIKNNLWELWT